MGGKVKQCFVASCTLIKYDRSCSHEEGASNHTCGNKEKIWHRKRLQGRDCRARRQDVIRKRPSIFDLAGSGAGKGDVAELKRMLDQMRDEDA